VPKATIKYSRTYSKARDFPIIGANRRRVNLQIVDQMQFYHTHEVSYP